MPFSAKTPASFYRRSKDNALFSKNTHFLLPQVYPDVVQTFCGYPLTALRATRTLARVKAAEGLYYPEYVVNMVEVCY